MLAAQGILTARGGLVSATPPWWPGAGASRRWWGRSRCASPARSFTVGDDRGDEGDWISIDGTTGQVVLGEVALTAAEAARGVRDGPRLGRRDPQGTARGAGQRRQRADAANARQLRGRGDRAVPDRAHVPRRGPAADRAAHDPGRRSEAEEDAALEELREAQSADFVAILEAMDGLPVTVRLLDPPLHEFLPDTDELAIKEATDGLSTEEESALRGGQGSGTSSTPCSAPGACAWASSSPDSTRCRSGPSWRRRPSGWRRAASPVIEMMIPLTVTRQELALARRWVEEAGRRDRWPMSESCSAPRPVGST